MAATRADFNGGDASITAGGASTGGTVNIDGVVDTSDFNVLAANFNATGALWQQGDFNFDGTVNALDFNTIANNFGQILPSPALGSLVPEPAALFPLALALLLRRRRK